MMEASAHASLAVAHDPFEARLRRAPQGDALEPKCGALGPKGGALGPKGDATERTRHPEVAAQRPSKDDGEVVP
jgi:hypothetical protein